MKVVIPSFFKEIKSCYVDEFKVKVMDQIFMEIEEKLKKNENLEDSSGEPELPTCKMYSSFILAHHKLTLKELDVALQYSEECKNHTPTFIENYFVMAKIYKEMGCFSKASETLLESFHLDTADRCFIWP